MAISFPKDANRISVLGGTSSADGVTPVLPWVDPTTHRLLVDASAGGITIGTTTITSGTTTSILYDNAGVVGEYTITGSGTVVAMQTSPSLITPALGVATATSLAIGGATLGSNGLAVTGHLLLEGVTSTGATGTGNLVFASSPTLTTAILGSSTATTQTPADNSTKIATTAYVDNAVLGQRQKEAVKYASVAPLPTIVYANGSSGVGATITGFAFGALSLDGSTPSVADRVLIKNQASDFQNGIYVVTAVGSGAAFLVLTRATDFDQASDIQTGDTVFVTAGNTLANTTWTYNGIDSPTMGTTSLTFVQAAGQGSFTGGNGITITGTSIAIDTTVTTDLTTAQNLTNKTLNGSTNVIKGVTMTLGSDASGDMYYRNSSGVLTRIAAGSTGDVLTQGASSVPAFAAAAGGTITYKHGTTSYDLTTASGNQTIAHGLGKTPTYFRLTIYLKNGTTGSATSTGTYNGTDSQSIFFIASASANAASTNNAASNFITTMSLDTALNNYQQASTTWDATNVTLAWTKTGTPSGTALLFWEAWA